MSRYTDWLDSVNYPGQYRYGDSVSWIESYTTVVAETEDPETILLHVHEDYILTRNPHLWHGHAWYGWVQGRPEVFSGDGSACAIEWWRKVMALGYTPRFRPDNSWGRNLWRVFNHISNQ